MRVRRYLCSEEDEPHGAGGSECQIVGGCGGGWHASGYKN